MLKPFFRLLAIACLLGATARLALAATVTATYVKTLGQTHEGKFAFVTGGGRIAVDEGGNAYFGTPGGSSYLQKVSPRGEILWQVMTNVPGFQGAAVDDKYLYTCGSGYYGRIQLQRWLRDTGAPAPGWQYDWENGNATLNDVAAMKMPNAIALDDKYLFIADTGGNEIRRFEKESGKETPFKNRLLVVAPNDLAITPKGTILVLTESSVVEIDKDGQPLRVPVIAGLRGPTAIEVNRQGAIYLAEGGDNAELINRVRIYNADGKLQDEIGIGGDFNGKWHPLSFGFSSGRGDFTLDAGGGMWVNASGHRMFLLPTLTHITPGAQPRADQVFHGASGTGLMTDANLDVYVGGTYKIGWDNNVKWTSGLTGEGSARLFPTTIDYWPITPIWSDGKTVVLSSMHQNTFYQVNAKNGAALGKSVATSAAITGAYAVGRDIFYTAPSDRTIRRTTVDLAPPQNYLTLPEGSSPATGAIAVSPDLQSVFLSYGGETACYTRDGKQAWKVKASMGGGAVSGALLHGVLFVSNPDGAGVAALDGATGNKIAVFGDKEENGRPPIYFHSLAVASKDGKDYLFVHANARVLVYEVEIG